MHMPKPGTKIPVQSVRKYDQSNMIHFGPTHLMHAFEDTIYHDLQRIFVSAFMNF